MSGKRRHALDSHSSFHMPFASMGGCADAIPFTAMRVPSQPCVASRMQPDCQEYNLDMIGCSRYCHEW